MFCRPYFWLSCVALLLAGVDAARANEAPQTVYANGFRLRRWTVNQGLPQNRVACMTQTRDGYLWVGTWVGLARFDGDRFTTFTKFDTSAFVRDEITALAEDSNGTLWIGTKSGLLRYRDRQFSRFSTADGLPHDEVWHLEPSRDGGLWVHAGELVAKMREDKVCASSKLPSAGAIHAMHED